MFASVVVLPDRGAAGHLAQLAGDAGRDPRVPRRPAVLLARPHRRRRHRAAADLVPGRRRLRLRHRDPRLVRPQARPVGPARALTLFAVPVFVAGLPAGGLPGSFVAAGAAMLWMQSRPRVVRHRTVDAALTRAREGAGRRRPRGLGGPTRGPGRPVRPGAPPASLRDRRPAVRPAAGHPAVRRAPTPPTTPSPGTPSPSEPSARPRPYRPAAPDAARRTAASQLLQARPGAMVAAFVITVVTAGGLLGALAPVDRDRGPLAGLPAQRCWSSSSRGCSTTD